jgi:hypothetical protein
MIRQSSDDCAREFELFFEFKSLLKKTRCEDETSNSRTQTAADLYEFLKKAFNAFFIRISRCLYDSDMMTLIDNFSKIRMIKREKMMF